MGKLFINPQPKYKPLPVVKGIELQKIKKEIPFEKTGIIEEEEDDNEVIKKESSKKYKKN